MNDELILTKKSKVRGEDGKRSITIRLEDDMLNEIEVLAEKTERSRNEVIKLLLEYAMKRTRCEDE